MNVELDNQVASLEVPLDGPKGIVVEDGHAHAGNDLLRRLIDDLVDCHLDCLVVDAREVNGHRAQTVKQANFVRVYDIIALSPELSMSLLGENNDQITLLLPESLVSLA